MPARDNDKIEIHERLARMEALLEMLNQALKDQKECNLAQNKKLDKILNNDKDKLQRLATVETKVKNLKAVMFLFLTMVLGVLGKSFL